MFLKEVHLTPNHWSFRLLKWAFPWIGRFYNFCPHFWLTILAIVIFPLTLFVYAAYYFCIKWLVAIINIITDKIDKTLENRFLFLDTLSQDIGMAMDDRYFNSVYDEFYSYLPSCERKKARKYYDMYTNLPYEKQIEFREKFVAKKAEVERKLSELKEYYRRKHEEEMRKQNLKETKAALARKTKKERKNVAIPRMMLAGKVLGIMILMPIAGFVAYYLILGLGWIWYWIVFYFTTISWLTVLKVAIVVVIVGTILFVLFKFLKWGTTKLSDWSGLSFESCERWRKFFMVIGWPFIMLINGAVWFITGIVNAAIFLWTGIKTFKSNNCPAIIWEEKNKDITAASNGMVE